MAAVIESGLDLSGGENEMRNGNRALKDERYQAFHVMLIRRVLVRKFLEHEFFLVAQFDPNTHEH